MNSNRKEKKIKTIETTKRENELEIIIIIMCKREK
jgi:hypothetical protein